MEAKRQLDNCRLAKRYWLERVRPEQVWPGLKFVGCGTLGCFLGHCVSWKIWGELFNEDASPFNNKSVSGEINGGIFKTRRQEEQGTDYEVVLNRLDARIAEILKEHPELDDDGFKDFMAKVQEPVQLTAEVRHETL